jgi:hypothetical protein
MQSWTEIVAFAGALYARHEMYNGEYNEVSSCRGFMLQGVRESGRGVLDAK